MLQPLQPQASSSGECLDAAPAAASAIVPRTTPVRRARAAPATQGSAALLLVFGDEDTAAPPLMPRHQLSGLSFDGHPMVWAVVSVWSLRQADDLSEHMLLFRSRQVNATMFCVYEVVEVVPLCRLSLDRLASLTSLAAVQALAGSLPTCARLSQARRLGVSGYTTINFDHGCLLADGQASVLHVVPMGKGNRRPNPVSGYRPLPRMVSQLLRSSQAAASSGQVVARESDTFAHDMPMHLARLPTRLGVCGERRDPLDWLRFLRASRWLKSAANLEKAGQQGDDTYKAKTEKTKPTKNQRKPVTHNPNIRI